MPRVIVGGVPMHVEVQGAGDPVVLLHGGFCSAESMRDTIDALSVGWTVHAPERPGHGRTADVPGPMSHERNAADVVRYLDAAGLERAHLVGFSDGAIAALVAAAREPGRVRSVAALSANLDRGGIVPEELFDEAIPAAEHERLGEEYAALSPDGPEHASMVEQKLEAMWADSPDIPDSLLQLITAPALVMAGDRDVITLEHTLRIHAAIPGARLAIVPASHMLMRERPAAVNAILADFLRDAG